MKTINDLKFIKFINLIKIEFDFNSNDKDIIYRLDINNFIKIIKNKQ